MNLLRNNGDVRFGSLEINHDMLLSDFLKENVSKQVELQNSHAGYDTYRIRSVEANDQSFILSVVFHDRCVDRITISVDGPELSWDDFTPETAERDGLILRKFLQDEFGDVKERHVFDWGKVELWQDIRNGMDYQITITYQKEE